MKVVVLALLLFAVIACTTSSFSVGTIEFVTYNDFNEIERGNLVSSENIYFLIDHISGLQNIEDTIKPKLYIDIEGIRYHREFLGDKISTPATSLSKAVLPLGNLKRGSYEVTFTIEDQYANKRIVKRQPLVIS